MLPFFLRVGTLSAAATAAAATAASNTNTNATPTHADLHDAASIIDIIASHTRSWMAMSEGASGKGVSIVAGAVGSGVSIISSMFHSTLSTSIHSLVSVLPEAAATISSSTPSPLILCLLAFALYATSWILLGWRAGGPSGGSSSNNMGMKKSRCAHTETMPGIGGFNHETMKKQDVDAMKEKLYEPRPCLVRFLYGIFHCFVFLSQCVVYLAHLVRYRVLKVGKHPVYLRAFACASMPDDWSVSTERFQKTAMVNFGLEKPATDFCMKLLSRSGLGEQTYFPPGLVSFPPDLSMQSARREALYIFTNTIDALLAHQKIQAKDIDILVVNCSLFAPTPSLAAMIMNHYKMREDVMSYNLSGMGCSAGLISVALAESLLQTRPNSLALVVSTELITQQIYTGNHTNMLLQNCLFRSGGVAVLLSNKASDRAFGKARYKLEHVVRTTMAWDDEAYGCVYQDEDECGKRGVRLAKELMNVAGRAMKRNLATLGPKVLPWTELMKYGLNLVVRMLDERLRLVPKLESLGIVAPPPPPTEEEIKKMEAKKAAASESSSSSETRVSKPRYRSRIPDYTPNFKAALQHICIHAGGRAVIDAIQKALRLSDEDVAPSRAMLKRFGNTSSSSVWYEFRHIEQTRDVKAGEKVWQLGFGSGFKCNSVVWRKL